ncbi:MAG TPA: hypothetical protein VMR14_01795 [Streptosporangiaceae bacterium]|jgi:hypothetical protein|nr:hypothetical protein [Streptosporangiaceae bacterium]
MIASRIGRSLLIAAATATVATVVPIAAANASPDSASACPSCGHNLILNPGAEAGKGTASDSKVKVPDWKPQTGGFTAAQYAWSDSDVTAKSPGPKHRGKNYFYGGPDAAKSTGTQVIKIAAGGVSGGKVKYTLSGWIGGYDSQGDYCKLEMTLENAKGKALASAQIGPVTEAQRKGVSEFLFRTTAGKVPAGTRLVVLKLVMVREDGSDNDGLADNLSLIFKQ